MGGVWFVDGESALPAFSCEHSILESRIKVDFPLGELMCGISKVSV